MTQNLQADGASRSGWNLRAGDVVQRREFSGTYTVLAIFRSYYGGEMQAKIRDEWGQDRTVSAGSLYTVELT